MSLLIEGWRGLGTSFLFSDLLGIFVVGFFTNRYQFGIAVCGGATVLELLLIHAGYEPAKALWIGSLIPVLIAIYFAQQIYISMGD